MDEAMDGDALKMAGLDGRNASKWKDSVFLLLCITIAIHLCCVLILASVPPISRDALIHHLAMPKMYLSHGGIYEIPSMHFSYFPMNLDLLYLLPLYFKNDIAAKYIHFVFALLTAGLLYQYLKDSLNRTYGLVGALFFLTIPVIVKLSVTVYVDLGLIFFSWACLYYFIRWYDTDFSTRYLVFSGFFCGLALGTKYNGLLLLPIMGGLVPLAYSLKTNAGLARKDNRQRYKNSFKGVQWGVGFILVALIVFSPWMIRNVIWKRNPVYPLFNNIFNPPATVVKNDMQKETRPPRNAFWMRRHVYKESFVQTISIPIRAFFQGRDNNPKYFDGKLNPFLLLLPLMAFVRVNEKRLILLKTHRNFLLLFAILFTLFVFFRVDYRIRYMAPALPPLVVLSVFGIRNTMLIVSKQTGWVKRTGSLLAVAVVTVALCYNGYYLYGQFNYIRPLDYLTQKVDRDAYISRFRREHAVVQYANQILPQDSRVLCLSIGDRTYYIDRPVHLCESFYKPTAGHFSETELLKKLKGYGTTHIIIDKTTFFDWARGLSHADRSALSNVFQNNTTILYEKNGVRLLELLSKEQSG
jgi:hypothetical protein